VFARDGLEGATTRAISREAGVNEVTLFRHFGTKEHLLEAVVGSAFGIATRTPDREVPPATGSLRSDLEAFSRRYEALLMENLPLIRTMVGEIHRHAVCQHQALRGIFLPMREALTERLRAACRLGEARPDVNPLVAADLFAGTIFSEVLRRETLRKPQGYSSAEYRKAGVNIFLRGIAANATSFA
jgi:AcrR family transcriptional regulator